MIESPQQALTPQRMSHQRLVRSGWAGLCRADIINTLDPDSALSAGILASQEAILEAPAGWSHSMRYLGRDQVLDQQASLQVRGLEDYIGHFVRVYHNPLYNMDQRNKLVAESLVWHGTRYDLKLIGAHLAEAFLGKDGLAEELHDPDKMDCSEGVCIHQRMVDENFMGRRACQVMPQEIDDFCRRAGWYITTWYLEE